jgi:acyl-coenzyme A synthetase/AMP-(fatty) acid ligase
MRLRRHLGTPGTASELLLEAGAVLRRADALERVAAAAGATAAQRGRSVAVAPPSTTDLLLWLLALDGVAGSILVLSPDTPPEQLASFARRAGCDVVLDGPFPSGVGAPEPAASDDAVDTTWIVPTSGTTDTPKLVAHDRTSLTRSLKTDPAVGARLRWGLLYDPTRFAGLQTLLQGVCGGSTLIQPASQVDPDRIVADLVAGRANALSATPSMWRRLSMAAGFDDLRLEVVSLGGEIADAQVLNLLATRFPDARITHIYASTEAGVGFAVRDRQPGFPAGYLSDPPPDVRVDVAPDGRLLLKPERGAAAYVSESDPLAGGDGWIDTGDLVERRGDRFLFVGRGNGTINVGGRKVQPHEVEQCLLGTGKVAMVRVHGRRNSILGQVVVADVVAGPGEDPAALKPLLQAHCREGLEEYKRPAFLRFVDDIEVTPTGKIDRR